MLDRCNLYLLREDYWLYHYCPLFCNWAGIYLSFPVKIPKIFRNINKRFRVRMRVQVCPSHPPFSTISHLKSFLGHSKQHSLNCINIPHHTKPHQIPRLWKFEAEGFRWWLIGAKPVSGQYFWSFAGRHNPPITKPYKGQPLRAVKYTHTHRHTKTHSHRHTDTDIHARTLLYTDH